jgi:hypothetical protein
MASGQGPPGGDTAASAEYIGAGVTETKNNYSKLTGENMATKTYIVAENWEKDLLNIANRLSFKYQDFPGNIWQVPAHNKDANLG